MVFIVIIIKLQRNRPGILPRITFGSTTVLYISNFQLITTGPRDLKYYWNGKWTASFPNIKIEDIRLSYTFFLSRKDRTD